MSDAAYPMTGIPEHFTTEVRPEDQAKLAAAFPQIRLLWNAKLRVYQLAHREEGWREGFYGTHGDGVLDGWALIPPDYPKEQFHIDRVISELRVREVMQAEEAAKYGCATVAEVVEKKMAEWEKKREMEARLRFDSRYEYEWKRLFAPVIWSNPAPSAPRGPGSKERARRERRLNAVLREGAPA